MAKLNANQVVKSVTAFVAIIYGVCALLVFIAPTVTLSIFSRWLHGIDIMQLAKQPTSVDTGIGFITAISATALASLLFTYLWNTYESKKEVKP